MRQHVQHDFINARMNYLWSVLHNFLFFLVTYLLASCDSFSHIKSDFRLFAFDLHKRFGLTSSLAVIFGIVREAEVFKVNSNVFFNLLTWFCLRSTAMLSAGVNPPTRIYLWSFSVFRLAMWIYLEIPLQSVSKICIPRTLKRNELFSCFRVFILCCLFSLGFSFVWRILNS